MKNRIDDDLIKQVFAGEASAKDTERIVKWFATDEGQEYLSGHMDKRFGQSAKKSKNWGKTILKYAAVIIPLCVMGSLFYHIDKRVNLWGKEEIAEIYVPRGEKQNLIFQDGTSVYLGPDSYLKYPKKFGFKERRVFMSGEAHFDVAKNPDYPFVIDFGAGICVRVLGTSFNVMAYAENEEIRILLEEGKVVMTSASCPNGVEMKPGEYLQYNKSTKKMRLNKPTDKCFYMTNWKNDQLIFRQMPLKELLRIMERKYDASFSVKDSTLLSISYTMQIHNKTLDEVLQSLENITPVHFLRKDSLIYIIRK